jgi:hypothetical protein
VVDSLPCDHDIASTTWTRQAVAELIAKRTGVDLTLLGVGHYRRRWGLTPQKPARQAREQDPADVRVFVEQKLPAVKELAELEDAQLNFVDEVGGKTVIRSARVMRPKAKRRCRRSPRAILSRTSFRV